MKLDDQFEWDLDNPHASPEQFSEVYTKELGLNGEFKYSSVLRRVITYSHAIFTGQRSPTLSVNKFRCIKSLYS